MIEEIQQDPADSQEVGFDFEKHRMNSEDDYRRVRHRYEDFAGTLERLLDSSLTAADVQVHSIEARAKTVDSFGRKASLPSPSDAASPKYPDPLKQITDLAAVRVISFFLDTLNAIDQCIQREFDIIERIDKAATRDGQPALGYQSLHYIVTLKSNRASLPEYARFAGIRAEVQSRTILQHAWAEIEHDIQYKALDVLPNEIRRRFLALAGMLEIGDREFQAIADSHATLQAEARSSVEAGDLAVVEITPDSLKAYLDGRLGPDGRMRSFSYEWTTRLLKRLGFTNLAQVERSIKEYNDDEVSRVIHGSRQGQLTRFEDVLLASMGNEFANRHIFNNTSNSDWWPASVSQRLERLEAAGINPSGYLPENDAAVDTSEVAK